MIQQTSRQTAGFTLFECLIYLSLIAGISLLMGVVGSRFFESHFRLFRATDTTVSLYIVGLHIARDIQHAPANKQLWEIAPDALAWQGEQRHGWKLRDKKLLRTEGHEISAVADDIDACEFQAEVRGEAVLGVRFSLEKGGQRMSRFVTLYERIAQCS